MKKIEAIIRPDRLPAVRKALEEVGFGGLTISQVTGHGKQRGITAEWKGTPYTIDLLQKVRLEVVVADSELEGVLSAIADAAQTGEIGDGKIFISTIDDAMRIRTRERGPAAL